jgi:hypothetical protein
MSMTKLLCGLAILPLVAGIAVAAPLKPAKQPVQLSDKQMDKVTAGWDLQETDYSNTSQVWISIYERRTATVPTGSVATYGLGNNINCANTQTACYLLINNPAFSIGAAFYKP